MSSSNFLASLAAVTRDPKQVELVKKIIARTKEGKIVWQRSPTDFTANVGNELSMTFVYTYTPLPAYTRWSLFAVRDNAGRELLKVDNTLGETVNALRQRMADVAGLAAPDPIVEAVNELYSIVDRDAKGDIDHAIALLDNA